MGRDEVPIDQYVYVTERGFKISRAKEHNIVPKPFDEYAEAEDESSHGHLYNSRSHTTSFETDSDAHKSHSSSDQND